MKLIVGLGNPGKDYVNTRHNVGFDVIDSYALKHNLEFSKTKFGGKFVKCNICGEEVVLLKPQKYINLSGEVVRKYVDYYKVDINDILIISDDLDLPVGKIKLKYKGSSGGHNGLKNIELNLGTEEYKRLKIGISNNKDIDTKDYVLGHFSKSDRETVDKAIEEAVLILDDYFEMDFNVLMSKYNK